MQVYCDNYLDGGYHVPHAHGSLAACLDLPSYSTTVSNRLLFIYWNNRLWYFSCEIMLTIWIAALKSSEWTLYSCWRGSVFKVAEQPRKVGQTALPGLETLRIMRLCTQISWLTGYGSGHPNLSKVSSVYFRHRSVSTTFWEWILMKFCTLGVCRPLSDNRQHPCSFRQQWSCESYMDQCGIRD